MGWFVKKFMSFPPRIKLRKETTIFTFILKGNMRTLLHGIMSGHIGINNTKVKMLKFLAKFCNGN